MPTTENILETTLKQAAIDPTPENIADFSRTLLASHVYISANIENEDTEDESVFIEHWIKEPEGTPVIPFFSTQEALESLRTSEGYGKLEISTRLLLETTEGAALVLNPKMDYGKEFSPDEVRNLLKHGNLTPKGKEGSDRPAFIIAGKSEENALEAALRLAVTDPVHRPAFYRTLLESTVYIIGSPENKGADRRTIEAGEQINIENWEQEDGSPIIPFFTSLEVLQSSIDDEITEYLAVQAQELFELTLGANLCLNPHSDYGKEFLPEEIQNLLEQGNTIKTERRGPKKDTEVRIGRQAEEPTEMMEALRAYFAERKGIKAAYLFLMENLSAHEEPCQVIGIDAEGDIEQIYEEAASLATNYLPDGKMIDFTRIQKGDELSDYVLEDIEPFFVRK